jgi:hypothetical protein
VSIDIGQDETTEAGRRRADLIVDLHDLAAFLETHPDTPLPVVHANWRVPEGPRGERVGYLDKLAVILGSDVTGDEMGNLYALRRFGSVTAEGHLSPEDRSMSAHRAAIARRASVSITGSGATA